ncbi:hypothetical protein AB6A40_002034 [Gnathostoma spinigerum]|uniref:C-type lectin domain-containing protein n=1 Tax=Gnathostoma spinigerum TaxID=75299 RepID=A0ABD6E6L8_9BILA
MFHRTAIHVLLFTFMHWITKVRSLNNEKMILDILGARGVGIREATRVDSIDGCMEKCGKCKVIVFYADQMCVVFDIVTAAFIVSPGAICCIREEYNVMSCAPCTLMKFNVTETDVTSLRSKIGIWHYFNSSSSIVNIIPHRWRKSSDDYEMICQSEGAHLASIRSREENDFISGLASSACHCKHIGIISSLRNFSVYSWRDGTPMNYTNWLPDEPFVRFGRLCGHMWEWKGWANENCDSYLSPSLKCCAVCKKPTIT